MIPERKDTGPDKLQPIVHNGRQRPQTDDQEPDATASDAKALHHPFPDPDECCPCCGSRMPVGGIICRRCKGHR